MPILRFQLRAAKQDYEARTGIRLTYEDLAQATDLAVDTLKSMATRDDYNCSLRVIAQIATALHCNPIGYLEWDADDDAQRT